MTTATATIPQHLAALNEANRVRYFRADVKRDLRAGNTTFRELLEDLPSDLKTMRLMELLTAPRGMGRGKAVRVLREVGCSEWRELGSLTAREKARLLMALDRHAPVVAKA